jgi:hypothetical protein
MKRRGESHQPSDFAGPKPIVESQLEEEPVARLETHKGGQERPVQLACPKLRLGVVLRGISELGGVELLGEEIDESPTHPVCLATLRPSTVRAPVPLADAIQTQSARHHHEPGRKLAATLSSVCAQTVEVVAAELLQQVGIRVHRGVIVAAQGASRMQQQSAMHLKKRLPSRFSDRRVGSHEEVG